MADSITFSLRNNQLTDVNVSVTDMRTNESVISNAPLNIDETLSVAVISDSNGTGAAFWIFVSPDGSVNSNKQQDGIREGAECTLG